MSALPPILGEGRRRWLGLLIGLGLGQALAGGVAAFATRDVFAALRGTDDMPLRALILIVASGCFIAAFRYVERTVSERLGQDYAAAVRIKIFKHLSRVSARLIAQHRVGSLSMRFVGDLAAVRGWISLGLARLISAAVVLPATAVVLVLLDPYLAAAAAIPMVLGIIAMVAAGPRLGPAHKRLRARRARLAADMSERVIHAPELRLLGRMDRELDHLLRRTKKLVSSAIERARGIALLRAVPDVLAGVVAASVFFAAFAADLSGAEAAGALAAVGLMVQQLRDLAGVWDRYRAWVAARDKCEALLRTPTLPRPSKSQRAALPAAPQVLSFQNVSTDGLFELTATAEEGRKIAVVGGNGAGKSTVLSLAAGLERPASGSVTFGGVNVSALATKDRRQLVTFITARSPILGGTMRRALIMGVHDQPEDARILAAAEVFGLGSVLERLGGLDGKVAEAGRNLSAGETRRVLLARAFLSPSRLMLLDEPDDALDADARPLVEQLIRGSNATTLVVTHDLALARQMDEMWFFARGRLAEAGPPEQLLRANGATANFFASTPRLAAACIDGGAAVEVGR